MNSSDYSKKIGQPLFKADQLQDEFSVLLDKDDRILKASPTFERITGRNQASIEGHSIREFIEYPGSADKSKDHVIVDTRIKDLNGQLNDIQVEISRHSDADRLMVSRSAKDRLKAQSMAMEELLYLFVKHSPAALAMLDNNMNYIITSDRWISDYNLDIKDLNGKNHYEIFKGIPDRWKEIHRRCLNGATVKSDEDYFEDNSGNLIWNRWEIHPWHKSNGEVGGILMFTEVITRAKEAEMKFSDLAKNPLVGVYILQGDRLVFANHSLCQTLGYSEEALKQLESFEQLVHPEDFINILQPIREGLKTEPYDLHIEFRCIHQSGHAIWVELYASKTIYNSQPALIGTLTDISERKQREVRTERQIELYKELSFIISHQLRHEYVKLNGVVNLINLQKEKDSQFDHHLNESLVSFNKIDEYIFKLNDKLEKLNQEQVS